MERQYVFECAIQSKLIYGTGKCHYISGECTVRTILGWNWCYHTEERNCIERHGTEDCLTATDLHGWWALYYTIRGPLPKASFHVPLNYANINIEQVGGDYISKCIKQLFQWKYIPMLQRYSWAYNSRDVIFPLLSGNQLFKDPKQWLMWITRIHWENILPWGWG